MGLSGSLPTAGAGEEACGRGVDRRSTPLRLLLIDDALLIVRELQRRGYEVIWERVPTAPAIAAALQQQWDVRACDWVMPAFSAPAALKVLGAHGIELPVISMCGQAAEQETVTP